MLNKLKVLDYAKDYAKNKKACEVFRVKNSKFLKWNTEFEQHGEKRLIRKKAIEKTSPIK